MSELTKKPLRSTLSLSIRAGLGAVWFALWFFGVFPGLVLYFGGQSLIPEAGLPLWAGGLLIAAAHVVLIKEVAAFVNSGGTHVPLDPPPLLVAEGGYQRVRNPMYTCYVAIAIGEAIAYRSWGLLGYSLALATLVHVYVVYVEEPGLVRRFGEDYERYLASSGRWFPRIRENS